MEDRYKCNRIECKTRGEYSDCYLSNGGCENFTRFNDDNKLEVFCSERLKTKRPRRKR